MQSPSNSWAPRTDGIVSADDDEQSTFVLNGLLGGPTQIKSMVIYSDHPFGAFVAHRAYPVQCPGADCKCGRHDRVLPNDHLYDTGEQQCRGYRRGRHGNSDAATLSLFEVIPVCAFAHTAMTRAHVGQIDLCR